MSKEKPLHEKIYQSELYMTIIRFVGYRGTTYRDLSEKIEEWKRQFHYADVCPAVYQMVTYDGDNRINVKPLEHVILRPEIRKLAWQFLGPPPEQFDTFYRYGNGEPTPEHAEKMASIQKAPEKKEDCKRSKRKKK